MGAVGVQVGPCATEEERRQAGGAAGIEHAQQRDAERRESGAGSRRAPAALRESTPGCLGGVSS